MLIKIEHLIIYFQLFMKVMSHKLYIRKIDTTKYRREQRNKQQLTTERELTLKEVSDLALNKLDIIYNHYNNIHNTLSLNNVDSDLLVNYRDFEETIDIFLDMFDEKNEHPKMASGRLK